MKNNLLEKTVKELIKETKTEDERAKQIFYFVRDKILFDICIGQFFESPLKTLRKQKGSCITKASLLIEMMKIVEISARYHFVMVKKKDYKIFFILLCINFG